MSGESKMFPTTLNEVTQEASGGHSELFDGVVRVDGSFGEGGGQIIRNAVTLACILKREIEVVKIRANRPNPGLASQHLESILALLRLTGATSRATLRKGITEFDLNAIKTDESTGEIGQSVDNSLVTTIDLKTAGSITLCIQCILPYLLSSSIMSKVTIIGGTHVMKAPNVDYMNYVFIPIMKQIGYQFDIDMLRPGYYPRGGGRVVLKIPRPTNPNGGKFHSFNLTQRGKLVQKSAILNLTTPLFDQKGTIISKVKSIDGSDVKINRVSYASVEYFLKYENAALGFYRLVEGRPPRPTLDEFLHAIGTVEAEFIEFYNSSVTVDTFLQDQLIIYMTLAKLQNPNNVSEFTTLAPLCDHAMSAIHVAELFTGLKFTISLSESIVHILL